MEQGENKRKHLQLIQDVITRMGGNSFLLKGWSVSLITAVIGFSIASDSPKESALLIVVATFLVAVFWLLDAYYLSQERTYRGLYGEVCKKSEAEIDYSLDARHHMTGYNTWLSSLTSYVFLVFYAPAFLILAIYCTHIIGIDIYLK